MSYTLFFHSPKRDFREPREDLESPYLTGNQNWEKKKNKNFKTFLSCTFFNTDHVIYGQPFIIEASAYFFSMKIATCVNSTIVLTANFILKRTWAICDAWKKE